MLKDIPQPKVEDLAIAIVPPANDTTNDLWEVKIINLYEAPILSVLITAKGYGEVSGEKAKTTTLRYFIDEISPLSISEVELIQPSVFNFTNEYWVSFSLGNHLYDKKYVFVKGSISPDNFTTIPFFDRKGIMIR